MLTVRIRSGARGKGEGLMQGGQHFASASKMGKGNLAAGGSRHYVHSLVNDVQEYVIVLYMYSYLVMIGCRMPDRGHRPSAIINNLKNTTFSN